MSYESRIYIVDVQKVFENTYARVLSVINYCSSMNYEFLKLFKTPIDYKIVIDGNTETDTDYYGDKIKSADMGEMITWLEEETKSSNYRRLIPLLYTLKGYRETENQWTNLQILHYGYQVK